MDTLTCDLIGMTPAQLRMARAALDWTADDLAARAGVAVNTVRRIEKGHGALHDTMQKLQRALETAGVEFIAEGAASMSGGPGARLRKAAG